MTRFIFFSTLIHVLLAVLFVVFSDKSILSRFSSFSFSENSSEIQEESHLEDPISSQTPLDSQKPGEAGKKVTKKSKKKILAKKPVKPALHTQNSSKKALKKTASKKLKNKAPVLADQKKEPPSKKHSKPKKIISAQTIKNEENQKDISPNNAENEPPAIVDLTETQKAFDELEQEEDFSELSDVLKKMDGEPPLSPEDLARLAKPAGKNYETPPDDEDIPLIPKSAEKKLIQADPSPSPTAPSAPAPNSKEIKSYKTLRQSPGNPKPIYPNQARQNNQQGSVLLLYFVDDSGLVDKIQMLKSSGHSLLDNEALRVLSRQQYLPGQSGWYKHRVDFRLKQIENTSRSLSSK